MAKAMIVFEDVNPDTNEGKPVNVEYMSFRDVDCQDEPTVAQAAAMAFYELLIDMSNGEDEPEA